MGGLRGRAGRASWRCRASFSVYRLGARRGRLTPPAAMTTHELSDTSLPARPGDAGGRRGAARHGFGPQTGGAEGFRADPASRGGAGSLLLRPAPAEAALPSRSSTGPRLGRGAAPLAADSTSGFARPGQGRRAGRLAARPPQALSGQVLRGEQPRAARFVESGTPRESGGTREYPPKGVVARARQGRRRVPHAGRPGQNDRQR